MVDTRSGFEILTGRKPRTIQEIFRITPTPVVTGGGGGRRVVGPVRPGRDEGIFRRTGRSVVAGSIEAQTINQRFKQEQIRIAEQKAQQSLVRREQRQQQIFSGTIAGQVQREEDTRLETFGRTKEVFKSALFPNVIGGVLESGREVREIIRRKKEEPIGTKVRELFVEKFISPAGFSLIVGVPSRESDISFREVKQVVKQFPSPKVREQITTKGSQALALFVPGVSKEKANKFLTTSAGVLGFESRVVSQLIPSTKGEAGIVGGAIGLSATVPILRPIITGTFTFLGGRAALDRDLSVEERVAGGVVAGAGIVGLGFEGLPFARGIKARLSSDFLPVKTQAEGFKGFELKEGDVVGFIEPRKGSSDIIDLPPSSPLIKGGFGRPLGIEKQFLGKEQKLATSQVDFFTEGKVIPLERPFFTTPQEPTLNIFETRLSRLGLTELFKIPKEVKVGFGLPGKPQIGLAIADVGVKETPTGFKLGLGSELEAIKSFGAITDVTQVGKTVIKGQAVDVFKFKIGKGISSSLDFKPPRQVSTEGFGRVSGEGLISTLGISLPKTSSLGLSLPKSSDFFGTTPKKGKRTTPTGFKITPSTPIISPPKSPSLSFSPPKPSDFSLPPSQFNLPSGGDFFGPPPTPPRRRPVGKKVRKKVKTKGKKIRIPIRPSFTGIVLDIEAPAIPVSFAGVDLGIVPGQIRGTRTGLAPARKKKVKKTKKKSVKKKSKKKKK